MQTHYYLLTTWPGALYAEVAIDGDDARRLLPLIYAYRVAEDAHPDLQCWEVESGHEIRWLHSDVVPEPLRDEVNGIGPIPFMELKEPLDANLNSYHRGGNLLVYRMGVAWRFDYYVDECSESHLSVELAVEDLERIACE